MCGKRRESETELSAAELPAKYTPVPEKAKDANERLLKLSQRGAKPTWVIVWRRRGLMNAVFRDLEAPYRQGEPALVLVTESVELGEHEIPCWKLRYHQKISGDYPQEVELPIEEYVWELKPGEAIGTQYCVRNKHDYE